MHISVVVTCYNYGQYLAYCLASLQAQTHGDFEVIVVDDGSTDNTANVVRPFLTDTRFQYHFQPNQGQTVTKNTGIRLSSGDLIAFLDADDAWTPEKLARQLPLFANPAVGVVYCGFELMDERNSIIPSEGPVAYWRFQRGHVTKWLAFDNFVPFSASIIRRSLLDSEGGFDESLCMGIDWDIWLRMSCVTEFDYIPDRLILYRRGHAGQMSKNLDGRVRAADVIFAKFLAQHSDALSADELSEVELYNACSRADMYRQFDLRKSTALLWKGVRLAPLSSAPYVGLLRNVGTMIRRATGL